CPDLRYVRGYLKRIGPGSRLRDHQVASARSRGEKLSEALGDGRIAKLDHGVRLISLAKRRVAEQDVVGIDDPRAVVMAGAKTRQWIGQLSRSARRAIEQAASGDGAAGPDTIRPRAQPRSLSASAPIESGGRLGRAG